MKPINCISLFSNIGISEAYLHYADIDIKVANEVDAQRASLYSKLYPKTNMICGNILNESTYQELLNSARHHKVEMILATPPCQGMSIANTYRKKRESSNYLNDLIKPVVSLIKDLNPLNILIENVRGMENTYIYDDVGDPVLILDYLARSIPAEYLINYRVLDSADYGTPQHRKRLIVLISRCGAWEHPEPRTDSKITVYEAIGQMLSLEPGQHSNLPWHYGSHLNEDHIRWMKHTPTGHTAFNNKEHYPAVKTTGASKRPIIGFQSAYKRISWDKPCPTIHTQNGLISSYNNVHPGRVKPDGTYSDARTLSVREILILCGLPANWLDHHQYLNEAFIRKALGECFPPKFCLEMMKALPRPN